MNQYYIRYTYPALDGSPAFTDFTNITERSEAAARKDFKVHHKDGTILDVELVAENVPATKQQERDTLDAIRRMVEALGPDSYIATAFEGCFRDAEDNIENDFGFSMKQRLESAEFAEQLLREKLSAANEQLDELGRLADSLKEERRDFETRLEKTALPRWLHEELVSMMSEVSYCAHENMEWAADTMANLAEAPHDIAFVGAVKSYRIAKERREWSEKLLAGLDAVELNAAQ